MEVSPLSQLTPISPLFIYLLLLSLSYFIYSIYIYHYIYHFVDMFYILPYQVSISSRQHVTRWPSRPRTSGVSLHLEEFVPAQRALWLANPGRVGTRYSRGWWSNERMDHFKGPQTHSYRECLYFKKIVFWLREICSAMPMSALLTCWKKQKTSFGR